VRLAKRHAVRLRQSYVRVGKRALVRQQRYAHARQFKRANRMLRRIRTMLGRVIRTRKIKGNEALEGVFAQPLSLARRVKDQRRQERGRKVYALHAPEVECIGKGKAHRPYEFGVKVSVATPLQRCRGGQFVAHVKALPGNPYDGHTLASIIPEIEQTIGAEVARVITDAGYRGHHAPKDRKLRVYVAGQKRGLTGAIKRALRRRPAVEPVNGHVKGEHRMGRNYLAHSTGDAINAVLAAAGYNFGLLVRWLARLLCALIRVLLAPASGRPFQPQPA
jgi:IS5 family transposase